MQQKWLFVIRPKTKLIDLNLKEVWQYRDLLMLFVKRDVITLYKQTILDLFGISYNLYLLL